MEFKEFLNEFVEYNKKILKKLIPIGLIVLYLMFLVSYNYFRVLLSYSIESSWIFGFVSALILSVILILGINVLWFNNKRKREMSA
jgi:hypothetical protein